MFSATCPSAAPRPSWARLCLGVVVAGIAAGVAGTAMALLLEGIERIFYGVDAGSLPERVAAAPPWRRVAAPVFGGIVAGLLWWWLRATGGVVSVEAAVADPSGGSARRMVLVRPVLDGVVQVLTVGAGNSVGREGAPRIIAGAAAARISSALGLDTGMTALLLASAAGAGLAAMYNAPLGGAVFAVEMTMVAGTRRRGLLLAVPVGLIATAVSWLHAGTGPAIELTVEEPNAATVTGTLLVAPVALGLGVGARRLWSWFKNHRLTDTWTLPLGIGAAGALTGTASLWLPVLPGNGRDAFEAALRAPATTSALVTLLAVAVLKPLLTGLTLGAGATGGLLAPSFALGASAGSAVAVALGLAGWETSVPCSPSSGPAPSWRSPSAPRFGVVFVWEIVRTPLWTLVLMALISLPVWWLASGRLRRRTDSE
ncbi:chloride channel protein [Actinomyces sp.]|uniref:chloride channel protein n=1 Tax=Actinomyces sp. TaxID=29317 RepID=UPI0034C5E9AB